jgi:hypothetical protein
MSLEQALSEQTAAIRDNTRALTALCDAWNALRDRATEIAAGKHADTVVAAKVPLAEAPKVEAKAEKKAEAAPKAEPTPAVTPPASETAPTATVESTAAPESPSEALPEAVSLQDLQAEVLAKAKVNKQAVLELLAQYGAKSASTVPEADRAAAFAAVKAL